MSDDYAGADYNEAESDLGLYESEMEVSGYDAVTTTQDGMRVDEYLKNSGMTIDTVGDAQKAQEHNKKENEKAADAREAIREVFSRAHQHVDDHKYNLKIGDKDYEISHGDLKDFMKKEQEHLAKKMKGEKDAKKRQQMEQSMMMMHRMLAHMDQNGALNDEQLKQLEDYIENTEGAQQRLDNDIEKESNINKDDVLIAREQALQQEAINPDIRDRVGELCLKETFGQNSEPLMLCDEKEPEEEINITKPAVTMSNYEPDQQQDTLNHNARQFQNTGATTLSANLDF